MTTPQSIVVLGSTGSIGTSCLDVIRSHPDRMRLLGATTHTSVDLLKKQIDEFRPEWALVANSDAAISFASELPDSTTKLVSCADELFDRIRGDDVDVVVSAIVGAAGLEPTWAAVDAGKRVALANKESLVVAGSVITQRAAETGATIIPVDSEHSAIFQALQAGQASDLRRIILTASGGPFRGWTRKRMKDVTPKMALQHPTWEMGPKITIDSATMMNKALEIVEARWLFGVSADQISVVVHPQSFIHSFVEYQDGSVISQMSPPDMRLPIQYALTFPDRIPCPSSDTDWMAAATMELFPPDFDAFPALKLGFEVAKQGGTAGAILNAANEIAVERFLNSDIRFDQITQISHDILNHHTFDAQPTLSQLREADHWAREEALRWKS
ncbi:1-deoxy-D-xylulose-5-phosphate reductoisomerase [Fuerstiella marisgermanici]|uniref:1-deoxy-D-xylulose 5-phosphate reductoisomerase n=1 Tax=Fuerstiella marisgermanici TaxID=1891926 RepID=A0A1P8WJW1_9PLAN|nr:1-deoxy-D-xylulose-5-phosphate reductoisomerase [Fuerstiella marisgermanici]APZ94345.1 1-deoxy-D-xylulose 5-phosphate reductoisomerase [Fuerstiella marisgermanici]